MQCRRAQIHALINAKKGVEAKLNELYHEEARHLIFSIGHMSEIDNERLVRLLAQTLHSQVTSNWDGALGKPKALEELSAALDQVSVVSSDDGEIAWLVAELFNEWEQSTAVSPNDQESAA